ncbi:Thiol-disulfide isomerase or thioredoxin (modular protein) [Verrucomicrobia bacterium]|nr:Thiol-disulfide isomerase or thioredoxin (modular protein) [Verrucomicrobiota bacterium]
MRRLLFFLTLGCACLSAEGDAPEWFTNAQVAQEKARSENKFVLLDFTGSDWCPWCIKLKREIFDQPEFGDFARANLVLVEVDFPRHKQQDPAQRSANHLLAKAYRITGYPTVIVLDPQGQVVGRTGYLAGGPGIFDAKLEEILKSARPSFAYPPSNQPAGDAPSQSEPSHKPVTLAPIPATVPIHYDSLALKGISGTRDRRIVLINNADLMVGDTAKVKVQDQEIVVCCKEIREASVLITADGKPLELRLGQK